MRTSFVQAAVEALESRWLFAAGRPDPLFGGGDGVVLGRVDSSDTIATYADGRMVVAGWGYQRNIARLTATGDLDTTFVPPADLLGGNLNFVDSFVQSDGKVLLLGNRTPVDPHQAEILLVRLNSNGSYDMTFGGGDGVLTYSADYDQRAAEMVALPGGELRIVGWRRTSSDSGSQGVVYGVDATGSADTRFGAAFGSGGIAYLDLGSLSWRSSSIDLQSDGKLIIGGGYETSPFQGGGAIARLSADGLLDGTFGFGAGYVLSSDRWFGDVVVTADDNIVAVGRVTSSDGWNTIVDGFDADGSTRFHTTHSFVSGYDAAREAYVDPVTGRVVAIIQFGTASGSAGEDGLARFDPNTGRRDTSFAYNGSIVANFGTGESLIDDLTFDAEGRILAAATLQSGSTTTGGVARYQADLLGTIRAAVFHDRGGDGARSAEDTPLAGRTVFVDLNHNWELDPTDKFDISDANGNVEIGDLPEGEYTLVQIVPDGWKGSHPTNGYAHTYVLDGQTVSAGDFLSNNWSPSPHLDNTFAGGTGALLLGEGDEWFDQVAGVHALAGGKLLAAGYVGGKFRLMRFNADGSPDTTYGPDGLVTPTLPPNTYTAFHTALQPDGKLVIAGSAGSPQQRALIRFTAAGQLDSSFGNGGVAVLTGVPQIWDIAIDPFGRIVVAAAPTNSDVTIARVTSGGQLDGSFDGDGMAVFNIRGYDSIGGLAVQPDGKVLLAGQGFVSSTATTPTERFAYVLRVTDAGARDVTFGEDGVAFTFAGTDLGDVGWADVALMPDGRIVTAGHIDVAGQVVADMGVGRFTSSGAPDTTFGGGKGYATARFLRAGGATHASAGAEFIELRPDGSIWAAGRADVTADGVGDVAVARFRPDGTLDPNFGNSGVASAAFSNGEERLYGATLDPASGKLIVAGFAGSRNGDADVRGLIARFDAPPAPGYIAGFVFNDVNGDGVRQEDEFNWLSGRTVWIDADNDNALDATERRHVTNDSFFFGDLAPGTYTVRLMGTSGWIQTAPANFGAFVVNVAAGSSNVLYFGQQRGGAIEGTLFNDADADGLRDPGEAGLAGRTVYLDLDRDGVYDVDPFASSAGQDAGVVTDANGYYTFPTLPPGTYTVRQVLPSGWRQTVPENGTPHVVTVTAGATAAANFAATNGTLDPQQPYHGNPFAVGDTPVTIQAEDFDRGGEGIAYHDTSASNTGGVYRPDEGVDIMSFGSGGYRIGGPQAGEWLEYTIDVANAGDYELTFYVSQADAGATFHPEIDGIDVTGALATPDTGSFNTFTTVTRTVTLEAGRHVLRFAQDENAPNGYAAGLDRINIAPATVVPPPPAQQPYHGSAFIVGSSRTVIQAEDFDRGGEGVAYHDTSERNTGNVYRSDEGVDIMSLGSGQYRIGGPYAGEWMEYTIQVQADGVYELEFRVSQTDTGAQFHAEIDGSNVTGSLAVPNTGSFNAFATVSKTVSLKAGQHVLRFTQDTAAGNGYAAGLDWIALAPANVEPPPAQQPYYGTPFPVGSSAVTIQAEDFDRGGEGIAYHDTSASNTGGDYRPDEGVDIMSFGSGGYRIGGPQAGEWLEYTINVAQSGDFELEFRVSQSASGAHFHAEIDGTNVTGALAAPNTGGFNTFTSVTKTVRLTAGQHVLRFALDANAANGYGAGLDWIKVTAANVEPPTEPEPGQTPFHGVPFAVGSTPVTIEAEDFDLGGQGIAYNDTSASNTGNQYRLDEGVDIMSLGGGQYRIGGPQAGEWMEYTINVAQSGEYELEFRVSQSASGAQFHAEVDGVNLTGSITAPNTGSFNTFTSVKRTVTLSAGTHVLRLVQDADGSNGYAAGFDWMKVSPIG